MSFCTNYLALTMGSVGKVGTREENCFHLLLGSNFLEITFISMDCKGQSSRFTTFFYPPDSNLPTSLIWNGVVTGEGQSHHCRVHTVTFAHFIHRSQVSLMTHSFLLYTRFYPAQSPASSRSAAGNQTGEPLKVKAGTLQPYVKTEMGLSVSHQVGTEKGRFVTELSILRDREGHKS